jgi:hypothetical protein
VCKAGFDPAAGKICRNSETFTQIDPFVAARAQRMPESFLNKT